MRYGHVTVEGDAHNRACSAPDGIHGLWLRFVAGDYGDIDQAEVERNEYHLHLGRGDVVGRYCTPRGPVTFTLRLPAETVQVRAGLTAQR